MSASKRLSQAYATSKVIPFDDSSKFAIISDCHRGDGNWGDDFSHNKNLFYAALSYYYENEFTYIELGDGDELWENRNINNITYAHSDVFWLMSKFYMEGRLYMVYGNHDIIKKNPAYTGKYYGICHSKIPESSALDKPSPCHQYKVSLFPKLKITEGILLRYKSTDHQIFLIHGHQADFLNDTLWKVSRYLVLYLWHTLEALGLRNPASAMRNQMQSSLVEKKLMQWATNNHQILIAGHTHRPVFPEAGDPPYFNDGCCVHPCCITTIEIQNGFISLIKWSIMTAPDRTLYIGREELACPIKLNDYFNYIKN